MSEWETELLLFPTPGTTTQVDVLAYAALEVTKRRRRVDLSGWDGSNLARPSPVRM